MKNDLKRQCFNLSVSFPPFIKGERGLTVLLSNRQNDFWTCHFFIGVNLILLKLLKISNDKKEKKKASFLKVRPPGGMSRNKPQKLPTHCPKGGSLQVPLKWTKNGHFPSVLCWLNRSHFRNPLCIQCFLRYEYMCWKPFTEHLAKQNYVSFEPDHWW